MNVEFGGRTRVREAFPFENMAQMPSTGCTSDFNSCHAQRPVFMAVDGPRDSWALILSIYTDERLQTSRAYHQRRLASHIHSNQKKISLRFLTGNGHITHVKLGAALVQRCPTTAAFINTWLKVLVVLSRTSVFSALQTKNSELKETHQ